MVSYHHCLIVHIYLFNYTNRGAVVMWPENNQTNQRWVTDDRGRLRSAHNTNKCLDASAASNGAAVYIFDCHDGEGGWDKWCGCKLAGVITEYRKQK